MLHIGSENKYKIEIKGFYKLRLKDFLRGSVNNDKIELKTQVHDFISHKKIMSIILHTPLNHVA